MYCCSQSDHPKFTAVSFFNLWKVLVYVWPHFRHRCFGVHAGYTQAEYSWGLRKLLPALSQAAASHKCEIGTSCDVITAFQMQETPERPTGLRVPLLGSTLEPLKATQTCPGETFVVLPYKLSMNSVGDDGLLHIPCKQAQTIALAMTDCLAVTHFMLNAFLLFNSTTVILFFCIPQPSVD